MSDHTVLVVEDNQIVARDIQRKLERLGYAVCGTAASGRKAVEKAAATQPDLVLMDIRLRGDIDGVEAASQIRERLGIPVVYLTAYTDEETVRRAKQTEPLGYLVKPFDENVLRTTIELAFFRASMERKLRQSESWLRTTLRCMGDATLVTDAQGQVKFVNPAAERLTGWGEAEALGRPWWEVVQLLEAETRRPTTEPISRALEDRQVVTVGESILLVDRRGGESPAEVTAAPIFDEGEAGGLVLVLRDATERTLMEQALKLDQEVQRAVFAAVGDAIFLRSVDGRFILVNAAAERLLGGSEPELVGKRDAEVLAPETGRQIREAHDAALATGLPQSIECAFRSQGVHGTYGVTLTVCRGGGGSVLGVVGLARAIPGQSGPAGGGAE